MSKTEILTSPANPWLKEVRRAIVRGTLTREGLCVAESFHLLEEALRSDCPVEAVLAAESVRSAVESHVRRLQGLRVMVLADALFREVSGTESTQGVMALVRPPRWTLEQLFRGKPLVVVLDGVQDPGNAGAILRAGEAFGATGVLFLKGTVSPYNPKAVRASAGLVVPGAPGGGPGCDPGSGGPGAAPFGPVCRHALRQEELERRGPEPEMRPHYR